MNTIVNKIFLVLLLLNVASCNLTKHVSSRVETINNYELAALNLSKENRQLRSVISNLKFEIQKIKSKKSYLQIQLDKANVKKNRDDGASNINRSLSSLKTNDELVQFDTYRWRPDQLLALGKNEFLAKNYEEASSYFQSIMNNYPDYKEINDHFYFQAGVAAYESGVHYNWALGNMQTLIKKYPASSYFRGAKMWIGLTYFKLGDTQAFFSIVEEFRKKYRNTSEWKILSQYYEKIVQRYKAN